MKKLYTVLSLLIIGSASYGQSQRIVLVEQGTNASCDPCALYNPNFNAILDNNEENVVSIKYQWDFPGFDPMNEHNPEEADDRLAYYGINGVPTSVVDGQNPINVGNFTQGILTSALTSESQFEIDVEYQLFPDFLEVSASATCTGDISGDLIMRVVVIEREILFSSPPGSTDETDFYNVMKKFLPGTDGIEMEGSYSVGESFETTQTWDYSNVYNFDQLAVVVFIQDDNSRDVIQAAMADGAELTPVNDIDATATGVEGISNENCETIINPTITIRNNGETALTSATINYEINDAIGSIEWTGSLDFFETEEVEIGEISFAQGSENIFQATITNPNGETDQAEDNDVIEAEVEIAGFAEQAEIEVHFYTDFYAVESSWELRNSSNAVVASGGPYQAGPNNFGGGGPDANTTIVHEVILPGDASECYELRVSDSFGDGLQYGTGEGPEGTFGVEIFQNGNSLKFVELDASFGSSDITSGALLTSATLSLDETAFEQLAIFPNPSTGIVNLEFSLISSSEVRVAVFDVTGKQIMNEDFGNLSEGYFFNRMDLSNMDNGIYLMNIITGDSQTTQRVVINK